jgi:tetratricopeptide (TPR) repeat protein
MAHDLLAKLGSLQSARADAVQLTEQPEGGGDMDLTFAVNGSSDRQISRASLVLFDGPTRDLLWSKDFELPSSQQADLQQQVAFTAGRALDCALEALAGERTGLKRPTLKLYLNGCTTIDETAYSDLYQLIPTFRQVTTQAPRFEGGWAKLVQVEVLAAVNSPGGDPALMALLKKHITEARKVNPHLAEAYLAEVELVAPTDHVARLRLTELATEHNPTHPEPFAARAYYLRFVGRMNESVESARRASELDPLSPAIRNDYISALTNAGQFDRARHELEQAERLWPGSSAVREARFFLQLRYGDPNDAPPDHQCTGHLGFAVPPCTPGRAPRPAFHAGRETAGPDRLLAEKRQMA